MTIQYEYTFHEYLSGDYPAESKHGGNVQININTVILIVYYKFVMLMVV